MRLERSAEERVFGLRKEEGGCLVGSLWFLMRWAFLFRCSAQQVDLGCDEAVLIALWAVGCDHVGLWECCVRSSSA
jgi:hypothetical protein